MKLLSISLGLAAAVSGSAYANQELAGLSADPNNWAMQAGDFSNHRYSELKQINAGNVNKLQVAWMFSTGVLRGHEGSPLVIGDTMYLHTPFPNNVFALDLETQKIKWKYAPKQDPAVIPQMCCDTVNRGVAYAPGKVFMQQADSTLVALDAETGKVIWSVRNGDPRIPPPARTTGNSIRFPLSIGASTRSSPPSGVAGPPAAFTSLIRSTPAIRHTAAAAAPATIQCFIAHSFLRRQFNRPLRRERTSILFLQKIPVGQDEKR